MHFLCLCLSVRLFLHPAHLWSRWLLPTLSCAINIHTVELCAALLVVPAGGGAYPGCSRVLADGALFVVGLCLSLYCFGARGPCSPASLQYCLVSGTY